MDRPSASRLATFRLDVEYTRIAPAFTAAGISTLLLKGPAFDQLLFDGTRSRTYRDIDLLVDPAQVVAAERLFEQLGFHRAPPERAVFRLARRVGIVAGVSAAVHAVAWVRDRDLLTIDLHHTLPQVGASPELVWRVLGAHHTTITVVSASVAALDRTASALLIALHAAHHGPSWSRASDDLQRACEVLERDCWEAAAQLARELGADAAMGIGLGTLNDGRLLARELGLRTEPALGYRVMWAGIARVQQRRRRSPT